MFVHNNKKHLCLLPPGLIALLLAACGGGGASSQSGDSNADATVTYAALVFMEPEFEFGDADFYFIDDGVALSRLREGVATFYPDRCRVRRINTETFVELYDSGAYGVTYPSDERGEAALVSVGAGDPIAYYNNGGLYSEWPLQRVIGDEDSIYYSGELPAPLPQNLTAEIPGDVFPPVSNLTVPAAATPVVSSPASTESITPDTLFRWEASGNRAGVKELVHLEARWVNEAAGETTLLDCGFEDDGEARIPDEIRAELSADFSSTSYRFRRESYFEYLSGDVYVFVGTTSAADR